MKTYTLRAQGLKLTATSLAAMLTIGLWFAPITDAAAQCSCYQIVNGVEQSMNGDCYTQKGTNLCCVKGHGNNPAKYCH